MLAIILKVFGFHPPTEVKPVVDFFGTVVSVAGMLIIGINIAQVDFKILKWGYYLKLLSVRVVSAVIIICGLLAVEYGFVNGLTYEETKILILLSLFPIAANLTVFASFLKSNEKQSALLVLLSMAISLILVPLVATIF